MGHIRRQSSLGAALLFAVVAACGGDGDDTATSPTTATTVASRALPTAAPVTTTTVPPPEGVETFDVQDTSHTDGRVNYPHTPPVGGPHNPVWETCVFRDGPVTSETAVHSLEHGAIWVTYRPDLPVDQLDVLRRLASSRRDVLVSRWDEGLPAPVVASSWGRQLKLQSADDPRLLQFVQAFTGRSPEPNAPC
ncbi:MAG: DUF3105 domain-containing protein, partial [Acidimicrobiales bacterium]